VARNEITVESSPADVWDILADGRNYGWWVVGSKEIRDVEPGFPAVGTKFHHKVGWGPLQVADHTQVLESEPRRHLKLKAKARPLGTAHVVLELSEQQPGRTRVEMTEYAGDRLTALVFNRLTDPLVHARNARALQRLKQLAEGGGPRPERAASPES
jgi:hypothetical protein